MAEVRAHYPLHPFPTHAIDMDATVGQIADHLRAQFPDSTEEAIMMRAAQVWRALGAQDRYVE